MLTLGLGRARSMEWVMGGVRGRAVAGAVGSLAAAWAADALPSVTAIAPLRRLSVAATDTAGPGRVVLSFDDGPDPATTPALLDILARSDARAIFFVVGERLARHPGLGRDIVSAGHRIGVHGWHHRPHLLMTPAGVSADIRRTARSLRDAFGVHPRLWRPPHGIATTSGLRAARACGLRPLLWTADGRDWSRSATAAQVHDRVMAGLGDVARQGAVVLLHDTAERHPGATPPSLPAAESVIAACRQRGWHIDRLSDEAAPAAGSAARRGVHGAVEGEGDVLHA